MKLAVRRPELTMRSELLENLAALREDWIRLAERSGNLFAAWEWNELWWRHFGAGRRLQLVVCRRPDGQAVAIVPMYLWRERPLRVVRFLGHGHGDLLGPVCDADDAAGAEAALRLALAAVDVDVLVGDWVAASRDWARRLHGRVLRETGYPLVRLGADESWEDFLASKSPTFRREARAHRRRLEERHTVAVRRTADRSRLTRDLDTVFRLHRERFGNHTGCYFCGAGERFHREFAGRALENGWLRLHLLEVDGTAVAAEYGFRFADAHFAYQSGRDLAWEEASVGLVLQLETIRSAIEEGVPEYRFLEGDEPYKYRFATEDPRLETIAFAKTRKGRAAVVAVRAARRAPGGATLLRRLGR